MGAPTGSLDVSMATEPRETALRSFRSRKPEMVTLAGCSTECFLISLQTAESGIQVRPAACCGVSLGSSLLVETERGSISPMRSRSPGDWTRMAGEPSANVTSISHARAFSAASRQRKVGAAISGGNTEPSSG